MNMDGTLGNERALLQDGRECDYGPYYRRSDSLQSLNVISSSTSTSVLVRKVRVKQGILRYRRNDENKCIGVSKDYDNYFNVTVLKKVNTKRRGPEIYPAEEQFHNVDHIYYDLWLDHFYREYLLYFAYGEQTDSEKGKVETKKRSPLCISRRERITNLNVAAEEVVRPETFVVTALTASGQRIALAPTVLGYIYHDLGEVASHPDYPGKANTIFPIHYVICWLAELFPSLYHRRLDSDYPGDFPSLVYYASLLGSKLSLPQARHVFRDGRYLSLRASLIVRTLIMAEI
ncbi:hypothetical protein Cgig2_031630 [Carnegiea gigantea]|uniref:Uncharacterized protein n=1 Tax=Carnegiea gigantea TaxID=171969 RepID=A0A9Q1K865_9CARY|nr:hypothetical protein Cgig2_031630 [Carnegiea gigantea]